MILSSHSKNVIAGSKKLSVIFYGIQRTQEEHAFK